MCSIFRASRCSGLVLLSDDLVDATAADPRRPSDQRECCAVRVRAPNFVLELFAQLAHAPLGALEALRERSDAIHGCHKRQAGQFPPQLGQGLSTKPYT